MRERKREGRARKKERVVREREIRSCEREREGRARGRERVARARETRREGHERERGSCERERGSCYAGLFRQGRSPATVSPGIGGGRSKREGPVCERERVVLRWIVQARPFSRSGEPCKQGNNRKTFGNIYCRRKWTKSYSSSGRKRPG